VTHPRSHELVDRANAGERSNRRAAAVAEAELGPLRRDRRAALLAERDQQRREVGRIARHERRVHRHAVDGDRIVEAQRVAQLRSECFQVAHT
jgi:hypothetical protein